MRLRKTKQKECRISRGLTLIEMIISLLLSSLAILAVAAVYVSAMHFFQALYIENSQVAPLYAVEEITRTISRANRIIVSGDGYQLKLRLDANDTVTDYSDDSWVSFGLVAEVSGGGVTSYRMRRFDDAIKSDLSNLNTPSRDVVGADPEIQFGLIFRDPPNGVLPFALSSDNISVNITLVVNYGDPPVTRTITTSAAARDMAGA